MHEMDHFEDRSGDCHAELRLEEAGDKSIELDDDRGILHRLRVSCLVNPSSVKLPITPPAIPAPQHPCDPDCLISALTAQAQAQAQQEKEEHSEAVNCS